MDSFDAYTEHKEIEDLLLSSELNGDSRDTESIRSFVRGGFHFSAVKSNTKRKVIRLVNADGRELYLKIFAKQKFPFNVIRFYARQEFLIARELLNAGVPIIHYLAWGITRSQCGFCISEGVRGAVPARSYFFRKAAVDPREKKAFLSSVKKIVHLLNQKHFLHPDFYTGNVIYDPVEKQLCLVDPWGIRDTLFCVEKAKRSLCGIWLELQSYLTEDEIMEGILSTGLAKSQMKALELWENARKEHIRERRRFHKKTAKKILAGHYKYSTVKQEADGKYVWRHTLWYSQPETMEIDPAWEKLSFDNRKEAEKIFTESFAEQPFSSLPVLLVLHADDTAELYFAENEILKRVQAQQGRPSSGPAVR